MIPAERPLSPHLQIYRWPLTMALSILHRATGVALSVGMVLLVWWLIAAATSDAAFARAQWFFGSWLGLLMLLGFSFSFFFHLCNGIRHLVWDVGYGFDKPTTQASGWMVVVASAGLTLLAFAGGLVIRG